MKILVATSDVPFVEGGHRVLARSLVAALKQAGHDAEIFTTPQNRFGRQGAAYLATRFTDVGLTGNGEKVDRVISTRFPSYALKHPHHVCWLIHRMREYYDLWPEWSARLSWRGKIKEGVRRSLIHTGDSYLLKHNVRKVFALSKTVQHGLQKWGDVPSEVLYPPPAPRNYYTESYGDFIFSPSRLSPLKRIPLILEGLALAKQGRLVIAGEGPDQDTLFDLVKANSLQDRVEFMGIVSDDQLASLYARCRAVYCAPVNEDFGMITLEAFRSRKPVITTIDSGGPAEVVLNGISGFVGPATSQSIANSVTTVFEDKALAEKLGNAGYEETKNITWERTTERLLEA